MLRPVEGEQRADADQRRAELDGRVETPRANGKEVVKSVSRPRANWGKDCSPESDVRISCFLNLSAWQAHLPG